MDHAQVGNGEAQDVARLTEPRGGEGRRGDGRLDRRLEHVRRQLAGGGGDGKRFGGRRRGDERSWAKLAAQNDLAARARFQEVRHGSE